AQLGVDGGGEGAGALACVHAVHGGAERDRADVTAHRLGGAVVAQPVVQRGAPDAVVGQVLDGEDVAVGVVVVQLRHEVGGEPPVQPQRLGLVAGPVGG